mgnify:CR=1 FL=1
MSNLAREAIRASFMKLISAKPFDKITVKEIIDDCQIARRTFYYHYQDLYAVVEDILRLETERAVEDFNELGSWEESFIRASRFVLDNQTAVYHLFNSIHRDEIIKYVDQVASDIMIRYIDRVCPSGGSDARDRELIALFYKSALSGIVFSWLGSGMKDDAETTVRRIGQLFGGNIERALKLSRELPVPDAGSPSR